MPEAVHQPADRTSGLRALSKITPPAPTRITPHRRLHARLDGLRDRTAVWIHGPPGAGKTSLVAGWLEARGLAPLWYRLDDGDDDPGSLFAFLGWAVAGRDPKAAAHLPRLTPQHALPAFARAFFRALFSHAATPILVFDDYHEMDRSAVTHALLAAGLAETPPGITVLVVGRTGPPAEFARLRANGQLAVIGPEALRLTDEEARAIVRGREADLPAAVVDAVIARIQGWAAGLILILEASHMQDAPVSCPDSGVPEAVFDYFAGEVFRRMDTASRDHLLSLAQLPTMTAETAMRLTGTGEAAALLERLVRRSYFTTRDAQEQPSYAFHPLFQDFLRMTARAAWAPERLDAVRRHAAVVLDASGQPEAAVHLLAEAGAWAELAAIALRWAPVLDGEGRVRTLWGWLQRLPPSIVSGNGWLSYWAGWASIGFRPSESHAHLDKACSLFEQAGDRRGLLMSLAAASEAIRLDLFADNARLDTIIERVSKILARDPSYPSPEIEMRIAASMYVALERRWPGHPGRERWRERALTLARAHPQAGRLEHIGFGAVVYDLTAGRLSAARALFDALPVPSSLEHKPLVRQLGYFAQAYLQIEEHLPGTVAETAEAALDDAERSGMHFWVHVTLAMAAQEAQKREDLAGSEHWIATMRKWVDPGILSRSPHHLTILARHELLAGRLEAARRIAQRAVECAAASGWLFHQSWAHRSFAEILQRLGERDEAEAQLLKDRRIRERTGLQGGELGLHLLAADRHFAEGRDAEGLAALGAGLRAGRHADLRFIRTASVMAAPLFARALAAGIEVDYVRDLVRRRRMRPPDPDVQAWPWPLKITTFGGLAILKDDAPLAFGRKTPRRLIELLKAIIAFGGSDVPETQIVDALWPEEEGDAARHSFTVAIYRLRRLLGDPKAVLVTGNRVGLNPELCWLDLWSFERLLDGRNAAGAHNQRRERALALYRGDFLAGDNDLSWTAPRREAARRRYVQACADLAEARGSGEGDHAALAIYRRGIEAAPTAEPLYRGLMACHRERGERAEGMAVFRQLQTALDESGRRPAPESVALDRALRALSNPCAIGEA